MSGHVGEGEWGLGISGYLNYPGVLDGWGAVRERIGEAVCTNVHEMKTRPTMDSSQNSQTGCHGAADPR